MRRLLYSISALVVLGASDAFAWNALGHKVVAELAWRQLDPPTRQQIVDTLRRHPRFDADFVAKMEDDAAKGDKATQDHWIFLHAATWPDLARGLKGEDAKKYDLEKWHYINLPIYLEPGGAPGLGGKFRPNTSVDYPTRTPPADYNVVQAIAYCRATLAGKAGPDSKALAYCWLMHLVGDIHQPLHAVSLYDVEVLPRGDRGGNEIPLTQGDNLHKLWDNLLGRQHYLRNVQRASVELSDRRKYGKEWESAGQELEPRKWATESQALSSECVYSDAIRNAVRSTPPGGEIASIQLPEDYKRDAGNLARKQIIKAGVRLGVMLGGE